MEKVILSKNQIIALEKALFNKGGKEEVLKTHSKISFGEEWKWKGNNYKYLNEITLEQMAIALYLGYEEQKSKKTPEEKILFNYKYCRGFIDNVTTNFYKRGVEDTLKELDIKIKGINE